MKTSAKKITRRGFTIVELLVVISIMAIIATLATGAVLKSVRQSRIRRVQMMEKSLESAIMSYRALTGKWPCNFGSPDNAGARDRDSPEFAEKKTFEGRENATVFRKILEEVKNGRALLDTSSLLTNVSGRRMTVREALDRGSTDIPIGYADPNNQQRFLYFKVVYNFQTDMVTVHQ
jgi:prepilin-type N-terminal cleavage/methylation domain-containing protein